MANQPMWDANTTMIDHLQNEIRARDFEITRLKELLACSSILMSATALDLLDVETKQYSDELRKFCDDHIHLIPDTASILSVIKDTSKILSK